MAKIIGRNGSQCFHGAFSSAAVQRGVSMRRFWALLAVLALLPLAAAALWRSLAFAPDSGAAASELLFVRQQTGQRLSEPNADEIKSLLTMNNIPLGASDAVLTTASSLARESLANGEYETAALCSSILHDVARVSDAP